jgi:hypothetical protein
MTNIIDLRWRIYNVFPSAKLEIDSLLSLLDIRYSENIQTAGVTASLPPTLLLNRKFIEEYCKTDEHLLVLLMHEMYHLILGHTKLFPRINRADNFAFDAIINSMICASMPEPEYTSFFMGLYKNNEIEALLRPPDNWNHESPTDWVLKNDLLQAHQALYIEDQDITYKDIYDLVVSKTILNIDDLLLLGNHDEESELPFSLKQVIVDIVGRWPAYVLRDGRDQGSTLMDMFKKASSQDSVSDVIRKAITSVAVRGDINSGKTNFSFAEGELPYPTIPDRRAAVLNAMGTPTLFYRARLKRVQTSTTGQVHIYLDVSGSMENYIEIIMGSLKPVRQFLHPIIQVFSTEISEHSPEEILNGFYKTTGGTDINCVIEHIIEHSIKRAVIITDGYVGGILDHLSSKLPDNLRIAKIITSDGCKKDLDQLKGIFFKLPEMEAKHAA